jgi:predicted RecB family nuclease
MSDIRITASMLYNHVHCPHRVTLDLFGDPAERDEVSPFVELLWERGNHFEREVVDGLDVPFLNLREVPLNEREGRCLAAMKAGEGLIYGGRIAAGDLLGEPDILKKVGSAYLPGDIKSGAGLESGEEDDGRPKKHYAVQLSLYADILRTLGFSTGAAAFVWDVHGDEVAYDLSTPRGKRPPTMWDEYRAALEDVRAIANRVKTTIPALCARCKLCHWRSHCRAELKATDDLTLIPELGRDKRQKLRPHFVTVMELAQADPTALVVGSRSQVSGVGASTLLRLHARARLLTTRGAKPYFTESVSLPSDALELFYDVETDPMRDICYLHGFVERSAGAQGTGRYVHFFADDPTLEAEKAAFAAAWDYLSATRFTAFYFYSPYERTTLKRLAARFTDVVTDEEVDALFHRDESLDLYHGLVRSKMEWPTNDLSIKTLASFLGFKWRDTDPSGASSIQWYHKWVETRDRALRTRILKYNEDDCRAMRVLVDAARALGTAG